jgi:hypothetical protein|tara:strand:- start:1663 stop:2853 length:1191 start_codon:yes stop_codon:yes gene_type:complete
MAYNILKDDVEFSGVNLGNIEDMVNDHAVQTVGGVKTFSATLTASAGVSASFFYGDGSNITNVPDVGTITAYGDSTQYRVVVGGLGSTELSGGVGLNYDGTVLSVTGALSSSLNISGSAFYGSGEGLTGVGAGSLSLGNGVENNGGNLQVELDTNSGLAVGSDGVKIDLSGLTAKTSLAGTDQATIDDSGTNKRTTLTAISNFVDSQINTPVVAGANTQVQFNNSGDLGASANLIFNSSTNTLTTTNLTASAHVSSSIVHSNNVIVKNVTASLHVSASTFFGDGSNLTGIASSNAYNFSTADFSVIAENEFIGIITTGSAITASLPSAATFNGGKTFTFKDVSGSCSGSGHIVISASQNHVGQSIDGQGIVKIQTGYGAVTIASDGIGQFYIVSTN